MPRIRETTVYKYAELSDEAKARARDWYRELYRSLEAEYEYQNSDERVAEAIEANGYEFTEDGRIA